MDLGFTIPTDPDRLSPAPADEVRRLHRLLALHRRPPAPFEGAMKAGSFNPGAAGLLRAAAGPTVKTAFTFAFQRTFSPTPP